MPTVLHRLAQWAESAPEAPAQRFKNNGEWIPISAREFRDRVFHLALFLEARGITPKGVSAILSYNCPQWVQMELAALLIGAKSSGLYPNSTSKDIQYILNHTEATVLSVQNQEYFKKINGSETGPNAGAKLTEISDRLRLVIVFDGDTSISPLAVSFEQALQEGKGLAALPENAGKFERYLAKLDPRAGSILIYTSGTTGNPKGALLSHDNLIFTSDTVAKHWDLPMGRGSMFSFLPLCHVAEQLQNVGVGICQRYTVNYCTKFENVATELPEVEPTLLLCVPRLWEKMMEGVQNKVNRAPSPRKKLALWALDVGARVAATRYAGKMVGPWDLAQHHLAEKLVFGKIRSALGLTKAEVLASGAATLGAHISKFFQSLGLEILEDFGQTESTGVVCMTEPEVESSGTVGKPFPDTEFKFAADGEILTRGRHVFVGYYKDQAATDAALDKEGWLHTGDVGEWTDRGMVRILGRKKEVLKTSGGKMVAPVPIEERLKAFGIVGQACVVGDGRKYLAVLITLSESALADAHTQGWASQPLITEESVLSQVRKHVDNLNQQLASFEQIKKFAILSREFSIADGEMTPTLKMKRNVIETRFRDVIDQMYK